MFTIKKVPFLKILKKNRVYQINQLPCLSISVERMADSSEAKEAGLTTGQLLESIQASEAELFDALKRAYAIKVNEKWKIIKELDSIMLEISRTVTNLNLSSDSVNLTELTEVINSAEELYPLFAIRHALLQVSEQKSSTLFAIDMDKLSVQVGLVLLKKASKMHLDDFVDVWKCAVPELGEAKCEVDHILGSAYLGDEKRPTVNFLDPLTLPTDPLRLFERLFQIKKKVIFQLGKCFFNEFIFTVERGGASSTD